MGRKKRRLAVETGLENRTPRAVSWFLLSFLLFMTFFSNLFLTPATSASDLYLNRGNVAFVMKDHGVIAGGITWPHSFRYQTDSIEDSYLAIHHDAYPSEAGNIDIANSYGFGTGDFTLIERNAWVEEEAFQETHSSFIQTGVVGVSHDLNITQRAFSKEGEDWAIVMWKLSNIYGQDIHDLRVGMTFRTRINNTPGEDIDHWSATDSVYYVEDGPTGTTLMGLASADPTFPINHYYGSPRGTPGAVVPSDDTSLYESLMTNKTHGSAADMTIMVGWEVGTLPIDSYVSLPLIIAFGDTYENLKSVVERAKEFLITQKIWLMITEIQDSSSTGSVKIEIYNRWGKAFSTSNLYLSPDGLTPWMAGSWSKSTISPLEYSFYSLGSGEAFPSLEGGTINLHYYDGFILDSVPFGQLGPAPDPLIDESVARYWTQDLSFDKWSRDPTPTFGVMNDGLGLLDARPVVLNEVFFNANSSNDRFVEISYVGPGSVDTGGWMLVVDSQYTLPSVTLDIVNRFFVLRGEDFPANFDMDDGTLNGDNVYLYDNLGRLVDMVGWSTGQTRGLSMARVREWGFEGFDDFSSVNAGWRFDRNPTSEAIHFSPNQFERAYLGHTAQYNISMHYFGSGYDVLDITLTSSLGWTTSITDAFGYPILDHDGDTLPDGDLMHHGNALGMVARVTVPLDSEMSEMNVVYVTATSSANTNVLNTVDLRTFAVTNPYVLVNKTAEPETIWIEGSPVPPRETTITLNVTGSGATLDSLAQDTVLVIDNSGSMSWNDPGGLRLSAAKAYVDMIGTTDRIAVVRFASSAILVGGHHLTSDFVQVKANLDSFPPPDGGTSIASGLTTATIELMDYGRPDHTKVEILLTDGRSDYQQTVQAAQAAANEGIIIFTIALGSDIDAGLLQHVAYIAGGKYYHAPTADALDDIYLTIYQSLEGEGIAGRKIEDHTTPNPMIRDVLPPYIHYKPWSFRDHNYNPRPPDVISVDSKGNTILDWDIDEILIKQSWVVKFEVTSSLDGQVPVGVYPTSRVNYTKWDNSTESLPFPEVFVNVLVPEPVNPPILSVEADQNDVHLSWTTPGSDVSHYLIYRAPHQRGFDFLNPTYSTLSDPNPTRTDWTDIGAASLTPREYYYTVRAVNNVGVKSVTSNTVGKFTRCFDAGLNAFSLPLEPLVENDIEWYASSIPNTEYIEWMDATDRWVRHWRGDIVTRPTPLGMGEGFQIFLSAPATFTFVGSPAAMIRYQEGLGSAPNFRRGLTVLVVRDDVKLFWAPAAGADKYAIYRTDDRMGFHLDVLTPIGIVDGGTLNWIDHDAILTSTTWYYMVVPMSATGREGGSTYTIGIVSISYKKGHNALGLPLKPTGLWTLDYYCENIPTATGMAYMTIGVWKFHATEMPTGMYDPFIAQGEGYQLSLDGALSRYTYFGY